MKRAVLRLVPLLLAAHLSAQTTELTPLLVEATRPRDSIVPPYYAGSSTVIDEETITQSGSRSLADVLSNLGGIRIASTSGNPEDGSVSLRGFGENASSRVLILVDGQPVNRPDLAGISLLEIPLQRIASIEILRGSQSARFGDNAVGGVINLITKDAGKPRSSLEVAGGSNDYFLQRFSHDGRYGGNGIALDLERNFTSGWRENSASELTSGALKWDRELVKGSVARLGFSWADIYGGFPGPLSKAEYLADPRQSLYAKSGQGDQYFSQQTRYGANAGLMLGKGEDLSLDLPFTYQRRDLQANLGPGSHTDNLLETFTFAPLVRRVWGSFTAELGGNFRQDTLAVDQFTAITRQQKLAHSELDRQLLGGFASVEWQPIPRLHLNAVARYQHSSVDAAAANFQFPSNPALNFSRANADDDQAYQLGIRYEPTDALALWLRFDQLYRLPSTDEIASYQGFPLTVPFNDQLRAETGQNHELGGEYKTGKWTARANGFLQQLRGEITYDYLKNLNVNFADSERYGGELDLSYQGKHWEVSGHYTALQAQYTSGKYAGNSVYLVPQQEVSATLAIHPLEALTIQAEYHFTAESYEGNDFPNTAEKLPGYGVANLLARYQLTPQASLFVRVNNLLDERYATVKYSGVFYPAAGRTIQCGARIEF